MVAAHSFELPHAPLLMHCLSQLVESRSLLFLDTIGQYPSEKMILGTKNVTELPQLHMYLV